jgi:rubrerythrin
MMPAPAALRAALSEALEDEFKARATYRAVIERFGEVRPFVNLIESEQRHIQALERLCEKYGVTPPRDRVKVEVPETLLEACRSGVDAEIENGAMYERLLAATRGHADVQRVLRRLQAASQERHLAALQRCVDREGLGRGPGAGAARGAGRCGAGRQRRRRRGA